MGNLATNLLQGVVLETKTQSFTGKYLYSDFCFKNDPMHPPKYDQNSALNQWARIPLLGIAAGVTRMALAIIHTIGHLFAALFTLEKGHLFHAAKGACEFLRGIIEAIPILGRIFANTYSAQPAPWQGAYYSGTFSWWIIKIYNPEHPDQLDQFANNWASLKTSRPDAYITA